MGEKKIYSYYIEHGPPQVNRDLVVVVRCKDCKHRPIDRREESVAYYAEMKGVGLEFPDDHCPCQCGDRWYSWYPSDDWFCASGERRDDDANLS